MYDNNLQELLVSNSRVFFLCSNNFPTSLLNKGASPTRVCSATWTPYLDEYMKPVEPIQWQNDRLRLTDDWDTLVCLASKQPFCC